MNDYVFIDGASEVGKDTKEASADLLDKFKKIDEEVNCHHELATPLYIAEAILSQAETPGPVIECGCYYGGMSAKLCLVS